MPACLSLSWQTLQCTAISALGNHLVLPFPCVHTQKCTRTAIIKSLWLLKCVQLRSVRCERMCCWNNRAWGGEPVGKKPAVHLVDVRLFGSHCLRGHADGRRERESKRERKEESRQEVIKQSQRGWMAGWMVWKKRMVEKIKDRGMVGGGWAKRWVSLQHGSAHCLLWPPAPLSGAGWSISVA